MSSKILDILMVVDVEGALTSGLQNNIYLIDTNKYFGSGSEGQAELETTCVDGQVLRWRVASVSPNMNVMIHGFSGKAVDDKIAVPAKFGTTGDTFWEARVETQGSTGKWQYNASLTFNGSKPIPFDPFLNVVATAAEERSA